MEVSPIAVEPALTSKCSQQRPPPPSFSPVSRSKRPPTSQKGTIANPCTRVRHYIRPFAAHFESSLSEAKDPSGTTTRVRPPAATGTPALGCPSSPWNLPPCEGGLCASPGSFAAPPHAPLPRRFRLVRLGGRHHNPTVRRRRRGSAIDRPTTLQRSQGTRQKADSRGPMSCRGLSYRELHTPESSLHVQLLAPM